MLRARPPGPPSRSGPICACKSSSTSALMLDDGQGSAARRSGLPRAARRPRQSPDGLLEQGAFTREEIRPQAADIYERLGRLCLKAGRTDQAVADFQQAAEVDPARAPAFVPPGRGLANRAGRARPWQRLDDYLQTQPPGVEAYELKIASSASSAATPPSCRSGRPPAATRRTRPQAAAGPRIPHGRRRTPTPRASTPSWPRKPRARRSIADLFDLYKERRPRRRSRILDVLDAEPSRQRRGTASTATVGGPGAGHPPGAARRRRSGQATARRSAASGWAPAPAGVSDAAAAGGAGRPRATWRRGRGAVPRLPRPAGAPQAMEQESLFRPAPRTHAGT